MSDLVSVQVRIVPHALLIYGFRVQDSRAVRIARNHGLIAVCLPRGFEWYIGVVVAQYKAEKDSFGKHLGELDALKVDETTKTSVGLAAWEFKLDVSAIGYHLVATVEAP